MSNPRYGPVPAYAKPSTRPTAIDSDPAPLLDDQDLVKLAPDMLITYIHALHEHITALSKDCLSPESDREYNADLCKQLKAEVTTLQAQLAEARKEIDDLNSYCDGEGF